MHRRRLDRDGRTPPRRRGGFVDRRRACAAAAAVAARRHAATAFEPAFAAGGRRQHGRRGRGRQVAVSEAAESLVGVCNTLLEEGVPVVGAALARANSLERRDLLNRLDEVRDNREGEVVQAEDGDVKGAWAEVHVVGRDLERAVAIAAAVRRPRVVRRRRVRLRVAREHVGVAAPAGVHHLDAELGAAADVDHIVGVAAAVAEARRLGGDAQLARRLLDGGRRARGFFEFRIDDL